ncbi:MAG: Crp/Fnr family transcriptional regulator [Candidatus Limnocylindrales bacterium]
MVESGSDRHLVRSSLLLIDLPPVDAEHLLAHSHSVSLDRKATLMTPGSPINHVYFPETGALSEFVLMADGSAVEIGFIGNEGMAGLSAVLGSSISGTWVVCQTKGLFVQVSTSGLAAAADRSPELHRRLHHYAATVIGQRAISAACDRHHDVIERLARHLLAARDLGLDDELVVTHEFLALRLGVQRPTVTVALTELERLGAITHGRGRVTIVDRARLEQMACDCYWTMRRDIGRHLDWLPALVRAWFSDAGGPA